MKEIAGEENSNVPAKQEPEEERMQEPKQGPEQEPKQESKIQEQNRRQRLDRASLMQLVA